MIEFKDLLYEIDDVLSQSLCEDIIFRFNNDPDVEKGRTMGGYDPNTKLSYDLHLPKVIDRWRDIDQTLYESIGNNLKFYCNHLEKLYPISSDSIIGSNHVDWGYMIKSYSSHHGHYSWHQDEEHYENKNRKLAIIWYLNDCEGGFTEFAFGARIKPEKGKMLIFPASWPFVHRGCPPTNHTKYIITTFLFS